MESRYKILERHGKFMVGQEVTRKRFLREPKTEFMVCYKNINTPAHFDTLQEAKEWVKMKMIPDRFHEIDNS